MRIDIDDVRELINQRLQFATEDYEDDRKRNRNGMKCFHQGQVDALRTCGTQCAGRWKNLPLKG